MSPASPTSHFYRQHSASFSNSTTTCKMSLGIISFEATADISQLVGRCCCCHLEQQGCQRGKSRLGHFQCVSGHRLGVLLYSWVDPVGSLVFSMLTQGQNIHATTLKRRSSCSGLFRSWHRYMAGHQSLAGARPLPASTSPGRSCPWSCR
jgi:hypothetical protein